jgi:hypothetical protein
MNQQKPPREKSPYSSYARYSGIAIQMIVIIGLGSYGGIKLDEAYPNEYHLYTLICSLASIAIAMYVVIRQASNISKN